MRGGSSDLMRQLAQISRRGSLAGSAETDELPHFGWTPPPLGCSAPAAGRLLTVSLSQTCRPTSILSQGAVLDLSVQTVSRSLSSATRLPTYTEHPGLRGTWTWPAWQSCRFRPTP